MFFDEKGRKCTDQFGQTLEVCVGHGHLGDQQGHASHEVEETADGHQTAENYPSVSETAL